MRLCVGCMENIQDSDNICPHCGYLKDTPAKEAYHIPPGTILADRYVIGRVLGYGGFGVTYLGWDAQLERKVAVKEYLPSDFATRMPGDSKVTVYANEAGEQFHAGLKSFVNEAQRLAKFNSQPGIVDIYNSFALNNTAYIVMEYLEGQTVKELLKEKGAIPYEQAREIILPVLDTLQKIHTDGVIHRDVAPDNIFLTKDGKVKLLDFGAARFATTLHSKSLSVILKPGFAPEEQYRSRGSQGSWTDVYAAGATLYKMLTGKAPDEAMERAVKDEVLEPTKLGIEMPKSAENALMNALNVRIEDRTQTALQFRQDLEQDGVTRKKVVAQSATPKAGLPRWLKVMVAALGVLVVALLIVIQTDTIENIIENVEAVNISRTLEPGMAVTPGILGDEVGQAASAVEGRNMVMEITGREYNAKAKADTIISQVPEKGEVLPEGSVVQVVVSDGPQPLVMPTVLMMQREEAAESLQSMGLKIKEKAEANNMPPGVIIAQAPDPDAEMATGEVVYLTVSKGLDGIREGQEVAMPDLWNVDVEHAVELLNAQGLYALVEGEVHDSAEAGNIAQQSIGKGQSARTGDVIYLTVSLGPDSAGIPSVTGVSEANARSRLQSAGFKVSVQSEVSDSIPKGNVIRQSPTSGTQGKQGDTVTIYVSSGTPSTVNVPGVVGMTEAAGKRTLTDAGFTVNVSQEYSSRYDKGIIMQQSPSSGSRKPGTAVSITVSRGPEAVSESSDEYSGSAETMIMPDVVGMTELEAAGILTEMGVNVMASPVAVDYDEDIGRVVSQSPYAGQRVALGSDVLIVVGEYIE